MVTCSASVARRRSRATGAFSSAANSTLRLRWLARCCWRPGSSPRLCAAAGATGPDQVSGVGARPTPSAGSGYALSAPDEQPNMSKTTTSMKTGKPLEPLRKLTEAEVMAAALADPDAKPLTPQDLKRMKRIPRAKIIRRALGLTQEEFAARFRIPLGTLRDWEQGAAEPDQAARAYLTVIARNPKAVAKALAS